MTTIFERETELGKCDRSLLDGCGVREHAGEDCTILAQTTATLNNSRRLLKLEQRCYLRLGDDVPEQNWVKPEVALEPAIGSEREWLDMARQAHECFLERARAQLPANCIL